MQTRKEASLVSGLRSVGFQSPIRLISSWGIAAIFLALALRNVDLQDVWRALIQVNPGWLLIITLLSMATYLATARRWQLLFPAAEAPGLRSLFEALMVAQLVNTGLPGRLGVLSRAYLVSRSGSTGAFFVLCTVLIEKVLEGVSLVPFAAFVLFLLALPEQVSYALRLGSSLAVMAGVGVACLLAAGRLDLGSRSSGNRRTWATQHDRSKRPRYQSGGAEASGTTTQASSAVSRVIDRLDEIEAFRRLRQASTTVQTALDPKCWPGLWGWSLVIWLAIIGMNYLALLALDIPVPFVAAVALLVVLQFGGRIPAPVAGIGVFHYLAMVTLSLFGVSKDVALGFGVLMHAITYLPPSLIGAWYLRRSGRAPLDLSAITSWTHESL